MLNQAPRFTVVSSGESPVLTVRSPGAEGNRYGFEGGRALKLGGTYHLFTSEMAGDPQWVAMRLAHWTSPDRLHWRRDSTLFQSSADHTGADPRTALWSPMPIYDDASGRWDLFYVAYRATARHPNVEGHIWRAISTVAGPYGIDGPYEDAAIILEPGPASDPWEGLQGTDSFFPYRVADGWCALYGSANIEATPSGPWLVGLASAPDLSGPWTRRSALNPLPIEARFIENPIVTRLDDGLYLAVYDTGINVASAIGVAYSGDGIHWERAEPVVVQPEGPARWAHLLRTPLGLIAEEDGTFTLFYTAYEQGTQREGSFGIGSLGLATLRRDGGAP